MTPASARVAAPTPPAAVPGPAARRRRIAALAVAAVLAALVPAGTAAAQEPEVGADGTAPPDVVVEPVPEEPEPGAPEHPFPDVPGVRLRRLGHVGVPLDADLIARATAPLPDDPRERVVEISERLAELPAQLDGLTGAEAVLVGAVRGLDERARAARAAAVVADLVAADTAARLVDAEERLRERAVALDVHRRRMAEVAVAAYVRPPDADSMSRVLGGAAVTNDDLAAEVLFDVKADHDALVRDDLEVARAVSAEAQRAARQDAGTAAERAEAQRQVLGREEARRDAHRRALDAVAGARATLAEALPALRADMDRTIEQTWGSLDALAAGPGVDGGAIVTVDGIRVHAAVAGRLQALLDAAHADGVPLGGWGHRSIDQQIALRQAHCGPTPEDIWMKPSSACSPPTARPGASMHERGLAVDFHLAGRSISSHDSPGYRWLAEHAPAFGFHNLPSEPWHWSVNAQ